MPKVWRFLVAAHELLVCLPLCVGVTTCPAYVSSAVAPKPWAYFRDAVGWNPHVVMRQFFSDLERTLLANHDVDVFGCHVPINDMRCHQRDVVEPQWLHPPSPLPPVKVSLDFECLQGLISTSSVTDVAVWVHDMETLADNITLHFEDLRAVFTIRVDIDLPSLGFIKLPHVQNEAPLILENLSMSTMLPMTGRCHAQTSNVTFDVGELEVHDFELSVVDFHPIQTALAGALAGICGKNALLGAACGDLLAAADAGITQSLSRELLHRVPFLIAKSLGSKIEAVVERQRVPCAQLTGSNSWRIAVVFALLSPIAACCCLRRRCEDARAATFKGVGRDVEAPEGSETALVPGSTFSQAGLASGSEDTTVSSGEQARRYRGHSDAREQMQLLTDE